MCRLYGFRASAPSQVECTLVRAQNALLAQSRTDQRGVANADGWGIGFYGNGTPEIEKCDTAAFQDLRFSEAAQQVHSPTVIAHVRRATVGTSQRANTHPFSFGVWTFAHNGTVTAFDRVAPELERQTEPRLLEHRQGSTDSELVFLWLVGRLADAGLDSEGPCRDLGRLVEVFASSVGALVALSRRLGATEPTKLNLLLTDGVVLVASRRGNTLYCVERQGVHDCEVCGSPHLASEGDADYRAAIVASEPISREAWREVPEGSLVSIDGDIALEIVPLGGEGR